MKITQKFTNSTSYLYKMPDPGEIMSKTPAGKNLFNIGFFKDEKMFNSKRFVFQIGSHICEDELSGDHNKIGRIPLDHNNYLTDGDVCM